MICCVVKYTRIGHYLALFVQEIVGVRRNTYFKKQQKR